MFQQDDASNIEIYAKILQDGASRGYLLTMFANINLGLFIFNYLLNSSQKEILIQWHQRSLIQKEMDVILSKLEEAVISTNEDNKISLTNQRGNKIINMIKSHEIKKQIDRNKKNVYGL